VTRLLLRLLTSPDPDEAARGYHAPAQAADCAPLLDHLYVRLHTAWRRAKGDARDRAQAALRVVLLLSFRVRCRQGAEGTAGGVA
jgi:hypothetical protein